MRVIIELKTITSSYNACENKFNLQNDAFYTSCKSMLYL